jgi:hypothetical protein
MENLVTDGWKQLFATLALAVLIGVPACGRPSDTVAVDPGGTKLDPVGRTLAPRMLVTDHRGRDLTVPTSGQVMVLSFASRSTADEASERCRAVRVAHPAVTVLEIMDLSSAPGFLASKIKSKLAERHETILADTRKAFAAAQQTPPADLEDRIHIVPATNAGDEIPVAVIGPDGALASFFASTPTADQLDAAVVQAARAPMTGSQGAGAR